MNETLRQALFRAGLTEDDVAARLGVDPKTVRRWLEGRLPYPRLRWQLAALLATDEIELWPGFVTAPGPAGRSPEIVAVYPHVTSVPAELSRRLISSAKDEIGILADSGVQLARDSKLVALLRSRSVAGVRLRVALGDPEHSDTSQESCAPSGDAATTDRAAQALRQLLGLLDSPSGEVRLYRAVPYNLMLLADHDILVSQRVHGLPFDQSPVLHLHDEPDGELMAGYRASFEDLWASSREAR